ncbi:MAG: hypothetical protein WC468_01055 [Candidatus Paceibacterota bacterium]
MKLEVFSEEMDFIALDLIEEGGSDANVCRSIVNYFLNGNLYMRIDELCSSLIIEYDGERCSFPMNGGLHTAERGINGVLEGKYQFLASLSPEGCRLRFVDCKKSATKESVGCCQKRLVASYMPPPFASKDKRGPVNKIIQVRLIPDQPPDFKNCISFISSGGKSVQENLNAYA